jgi:hypothetical protein
MDITEQQDWHPYPNLFTDTLIFFLVFQTGMVDLHSSDLVESPF